MKISQRERVLILFASLLFAVILPFFMIVKPMIDSSVEKFLEYSQVSEEATLMGIEINSFDAIKLEHEKATEKLEDYRKDIPAIEKSYNIHYQLTELCERTGLKIESLNIGAYNVVKHEFKDEETGVETIEDTSIYESYVEIKVQGSLAQMLDFSQSISEESKYRTITEFTVNNIDNGTGLTGVLGIKFYAIDSTAKLDVK